MRASLPFPHAFLFTAAAMLMPEAAAHTASTSADTLAFAAWRVEAWIAASAALSCWICAAHVALRAAPLAAMALKLLAAVTVLALCLVWRIDAYIAVGLFLASWLYALGVFRLWREARSGAGISYQRAACYFSGLAVLIIALLSPVDVVADDLFSMHMVQHELLMLAAAPLLVAGKPLAAFIWAFPPAMRGAIAVTLQAGPVGRIWRVLHQPLFAWSQHVLVLWSWHSPSLFQAGVESAAMHTAQHVSFLLSSLLFWSSLSGSASQLHRGGAVLYVLTTAIHTGMLGALLTFSPRSWYPVYAGRSTEWGLTLLEDQQLGGLIMWVPAGFAFVIAGLAYAVQLIAPHRPVRAES
ncbi:cytochrome c oxidase assembly protein [Noviherbaspirillum saxi]|uniref:Cytochrome c oxidase assembly protein n=1 Tax=Noviherbaspirillum saxi TaxID=2320863 RepID=A0A3A3FNA4_9BURK|nr:cytochrome c oxidase assembly protein [Noviherbaspirillum saxi]RJF95945.1 cytochrome c oxidase assembly protein [Noviherbaspirillum saxi]